MSFHEIDDVLRNPYNLISSPKTTSLKTSCRFKEVNERNFVGQVVSSSTDFES